MKPSTGLVEEILLKTLLVTMYIFKLNSVWLHIWQLIPVDSDVTVILLYSVQSNNYYKKQLLQETIIHNYLVSTSGSWQPGQLLERITAQSPSVKIMLEQIINVIQNTDAY